MGVKDFGKHKYKISMGDGYIQDMFAIQNDTDSRVYEFQIFNTDGNLVNASGLSLKLAIDNGDGKVIICDSTLTDSANAIFTATLTTEQLIKAGKKKAQIMLLEGTKNLRSKTFTINVGESLFEGGTYGKNIIIEFEKIGETIRRLDDIESSFIRNANLKTEEYNSNHASKINEYNSSVTNKTNQEINRITEAATAEIENNKTKLGNYSVTLTSQFDYNAETKTNNFNANAKSKTYSYDSNAVTKFNSYNTNTLSKLKTYNDNHAEKLKIYNDNHAEKIRKVEEAIGVDLTKYYTKETVDSKLGDFNQLNTSNKFSLVSALNEVKDNTDEKLSSNDIVNNLTAGGTNKVLSAEQGKLLFQSVSNGKQLIASAITDKGVQTEAISEFSVMANNIRNIKIGGMTDEDKRKISELWSVVWLCGNYFLGIDYEIYNWYKSQKNINEEHDLLSVEDIINHLYNDIVKIGEKIDLIFGKINSMKGKSVYVPNSYTIEQTYRPRDSKLDAILNLVERM